MFKNPNAQYCFTALRFMCFMRHAHVVKSTLLYCKDGIVSGEIID